MCWPKLFILVLIINFIHDFPPEKVQLMKYLLFFCCSLVYSRGRDVIKKIVVQEKVCESKKVVFVACEKKHCNEKM